MKTRHERLSDLINDPIENLQAALASEPTLINAQDEEGMTLLHHAAQIGPVMGSSDASEILDILFNTPGVDFTIKDDRDNTPLHVAALCCKDRVTCQFIFPTMVKEAEKRGFDFATKGAGNQTILHIAAGVSYTCYVGGFSRRINNVKNVLDNVANPALDALCKSGATAFFYAINRNYVDEAKALLEAGADPMLCGADNCNPRAEIEKTLNTLKKALTKPKYKDAQDHIQKNIELLTKLNNEMCEASEDSRKNLTALRNSAHALAQCSLFSKLPAKAIAKIVAYTGVNHAHTQEQAENIASRFLAGFKKD